jgi:hypothetical protein
VSGITYHAWPKLPLVLTILVRGQFSSLSAGGAIYNAKPSHTCADTRRIQRVAHSLRIALASVTRWRRTPDYEINNKRQMDRLEDDYTSRRISREEYESRKRQIESGSILY